MTQYRHRSRQKRSVSTRWLVAVAIVGLVISSLGCSLGGRLKGLAGAVAGGPRQTVVGRFEAPATNTPWPTPTATFIPWPTPTATFIPWPTPTASETPVPAPTSTVTASPTPLPPPTSTITPPLPPPPTPVPPPPPPAAPTPTFTPAATPTPSFAYKMTEVYEDYTSNPFLTGYIAIVNAQEIPIGGVKAVGVFEPGGQRHESPLSPWFFDVATAPGVVVKKGSVKFEPGGIQAGTWFIHLENEGGDRLSEDVAINTDPEVPKWFYIKFKQPGPAAAVASAPTPTSPSTTPRTTPITGVSVAAAGDWSFLNVKSMYDPDWESLFVRGEAVNDGGATQRLTNISGTFYNAGGQVIASGDETDGYWPVYLVPAGGQVPFELTLYDIREVADFDLQVVTQTTGETVRQDFEFLDLEPYDDGIDYCVAGKLRNPGDRLGGYLVIALVLYDDQGDVINFDSGTWYPQEVVGDETLDFEVCADPLNQAVADYDVRAWGQ